MVWGPAGVPHERGRWLWGTGKQPFSHVQHGWEWVSSVKSCKALAPQGVRNVYHATTETHTKITVLACCSAMGNFLAPLIIFKGERKRNCGMEGFQEALYASSQSGWTDKDIFLSFLKQLKDYLTTNKVPLPAILFLDGHSSPWHTRLQHMQNQTAS